MAGGRGERLAPLTDNRCKPAAPFGGKFRIIDFTLSNCVNSGIRHIGVLTQFKAHTLISHLQSGWNSFNRELNEYVELLPAQQQTGNNWYQGTADAVYQNLFSIRSHDPDHVLVLAGDHIYKADYQRMIQYHVDKGADMTIGCAEVPVSRAHEFGIVGVDHADRVVSFEEKPTSLRRLPHIGDNALASMGIYVFSTAFLSDQLERDSALSDSTHDFGRDVIPRCISSHCIQAYPYSQAQADSYWKDVGTLDAYYQANMDLLADNPELDLYDNDWPVWGHQTQLPPSRFIFDEAKPTGLTSNSLIAGGCIVSGANIHNSMLFSGAKVFDGSVIDRSLLLPDVRIGENCLINNAIIEEATHIPYGMRIGIDLRKDRDRFHVTDNEIVVVSQRMLNDMQGSSTTIPITTATTSSTSVKTASVAKTPTNNSTASAAMLSALPGTNGDQLMGKKSVSTVAKG